MKMFDSLAPYAHWLLRLIIASVFIYHGVLKFENLAGISQMLSLSSPVVVLVALAEVVGGVLVLVGGFKEDRLGDLMTRVGALIMIPVLIGAVVRVHWGRWNFVPTEDFPMGGMEFQISLLLVCGYLLLKGNNINSASG